ncbi:MAG: ATP-binding cassette domain-containing protein [SAR324 cluster bacterium]|uniref:ATP-binding cassette domain-containing protein n=1 Tax=SAR324 cluster bacterium TaxID=2024889 RepID=A0A7X9FTW2_9DELT|nr:ATP-binding cassette domain-containing protein [SAR324 cluster bacterium]
MEQTNFQIYKRVFSFLKPYKALFLTALLCMMVFGSSDGGIPVIVKYVLDRVFSEQDKTFLYLLPAILIGFSTIRAASEFGQLFLISKIGHNIVRDIRAAMNRTLLQLPPSYFIKISPADLLSRLTSDVIMVRTILTDSIASILRDSVRILALIITALYLDPILGSIAIIAVPVGIVPVIRLGKKMRRLGRQGQDAIGILSSLLQETILGSRVVRIFGREKFEEARFDSENERLNRTFVKTEKARALVTPINELLASLAISGVILYGGTSVMHGTRTQGDFIAFLLSVFLLYDPFKRLSKVHTSIQQGIAGAERLFDILDEKPQIESPVNPLPLPDSNKLELKNVSFIYPGSEHKAISNISLKIEEGEKTALVGLSGAGKSTLIDLIPRFIDPTEGVLTLGGVNLKDLKLEELRSRIALVGQHTFLFNDTIYNNIAYGKEDATRDEVIAAAKAAFAYDFIMQLRNGFDTNTGEAGFALSGGERQRIAIARAILKDAPILILDEATASLDNKSEREVQFALQKLVEGRTTIVIAHRLSTIRNADKIVVMKNGTIVEIGTHDVLLKQEGEFSRLYALQFSSLDESNETAGTIR